jgi:signal transduction histidine kinase
MPNATPVYRVLIVDDDDVDRTQYVKLLAQNEAGRCQIVQASGGADAIAVLREQERAFDCLLLDFSLPDMTGLEFLATVAGDGGLPFAVVLITGRGSEAIAVEAMKLGAQDYLMKDKINAASLWRAMAQAVTQTRLRQQLAGSLRALTAANAALEEEIATRKATEAELRAATEAAEAANRAKTRFIAMASHELRTPLNGILGYAELLRMEGGLGAQQTMRVDGMIQAGRHLLDMIERVLDFASIEAGRMELRVAMVAVQDLAESCVAAIGPMATDHALSLRLVVDHNAPRQFITDLARLRQVLLNLLGNAIKYTEAGSVELRVLRGSTPGALRIEVADTGPGIAEEDQPRLFHDFERLGGITSVEGAGLGLAIAGRIVGLMGGAIGYTPNRGGGSLFWLDLPQPAEVHPTPATRPVKVVASSGRRVLVVDDTELNRDVMSSFLRAAGHDVRVAVGGEEAIQMAGEALFDVILMDVRMPQVDGLEAARSIRMLPPPHGTVPILALTAYTSAERMAQCREAGMNGHIAKPVDYATLTAAVDGIFPAAAPALADRQLENAHARSLSAVL